MRCSRGQAEGLQCLGILDKSVEALIRWSIAVRAVIDQAALGSETRIHGCGPPRTLPFSFPNLHITGLPAMRPASSVIGGGAPGP